MLGLKIASSARMSRADFLKCYLMQYILHGMSIYAYSRKKTSNQ